MIPFNKPYLSGKEIQYIKDAIKKGYIAGNGEYTNKCQSYFKKHLGAEKVLLTTSCTDALEMAAILLNIGEGDEVIMPSFTFVSTANAFVLRGAKIVFVDSCADHPNMDAEKVENLVTPATKAIVCMHYAGVACSMTKLKQVARRHKLFLIEDAAQAVYSTYKGKALGSFGDLSAFSFHETKNIISGEGGMLCVNNGKFAKRSEIIWEKGTNRAAFYRGEVNKYGWMDIGSSFLPSDMIAAFLWAQIEQAEQIQKKRISIWMQYYDGLGELEEKGNLKRPYIPPYATNNAHMFYILVNDHERDGLISYLKDSGIHAVFHYLPLHDSAFFKGKHSAGPLRNAKYFSESIVRLPLYNSLKKVEVKYIISALHRFYN